MKRPLDLSLETALLEVPADMEDKVSGVWGNITCKLICRDCPAMGAFMMRHDGVSRSDTTIDLGIPHAPHINKGTEEMVANMGNAEAGVLSGGECSNPTKVLLVMGASACHGTFYAS
jgi:hypothetical protein